MGKQIRFFMLNNDERGFVDDFFFELEKSAPFPAAKAAGFAGIIGRKGITKVINAGDNFIKGAGKSELHHIAILRV